ncbi:MAG TPA: hypothetical protein PLN31_20455 [Azoarcus taiwanensis]|nr:hypothetical protein [Azoarcus taiwanensis]
MSTETLEREATDVALIPIPQGKDAYALFTSGDTNEADRIIEIVRAKAEAFMDNMPDITKASGRKEVKSFAYKITRSKTLIDDEGKAIVDELKSLPKTVDATRRYFARQLDAIKEEVAKPVKDWEDAEDERVARLKDGLAALQGTIDDPNWITRSAEVLRDRLGEVERDADVSEAKWDEYASAAAELRAKAIEVLTERIGIAEKREAEAAELERLRKESEERAKKDREEQIAREAAEKARKDAEAKAEADKRAADQREADLKAAVAKAAEDKRLAEERAVKAAQEAKEQAIREAQAKADAEDRQRKAREADKAHRTAVNRAALDALTAGGIPEELGKTVITLIATGKVPNVEIRY